MEKMTGNQFNLNRKKSLNPLPYYNLITSPPDPQNLTPSPLQNRSNNPPRWFCKAVLPCWRQCGQQIRWVPLVSGHINAELCLRHRLCYTSHPWSCIEVGLGPCHFWVGHGTIIWHDPKHGMTRNILGCVGTTVPCLGSQHDGLYDTTRILDRAWAGTARKQPIGH